METCTQVSGCWLERHYLISGKKKSEDHLGLESRPMSPFYSWKNCFKSASPPSKVHIYCTIMYTAMHIHDMGHGAWAQHCVDLGAQAGKAPLRSPFLSLPCSKEKKERKLETIALCIVSCQKDKTVLGANKRPLRPAAFLLEGSLPRPLPPPLLQLVVAPPLWV